MLVTFKRLIVPLAIVGVLLGLTVGTAFADGAAVDTPWYQGSCYTSGGYYAAACVGTEGEVWTTYSQPSIYISVCIYYAVGGNKNNVALSGCDSAWEGNGSVSDVYRDDFVACGYSTWFYAYVSGWGANSGYAIGASPWTYIRC